MLRQSIVLKPVWMVHLCGVTGYLLFVRKIPGCFLHLLKAKQIFSSYFWYCASETYVKLAVFEGRTLRMLMIEIAIMWANPNQRKK